MTRGPRGHTLMEALAAVALLITVILISSGILMKRHATARAVDERLVALSHVSSRLNEILARGSLAVHSAPIDAESLGLDDARELVAFEHRPDGLVLVRVELLWARGGHVVRETLVAP